MLFVYEHTHAHYEVRLYFIASFSLARLLKEQAQKTPSFSLSLSQQLREAVVNWMDWQSKKNFVLVTKKKTHTKTKIHRRNEITFKLYDKLTFVKSAIKMLCV